MSASTRLYLDHAATSPILPEAARAFSQGLENWANPSSPHADGRASRALLEAARKRIANILCWRHDVIFTSGATEAIAIAAARCPAQRRAHGATEHDSVLSAMGEGSQVVAVSGDGRIDTESLARALAGGPALVAIQHVNSETGVVQPLGEIGAQVRAADCLLFADCAQSAGKLPLPDADFIAISAHKFGGPPGIGALLVRDIAALRPSGGQEKGYRRGTENLPGAAAMAAALEAKAFAEAMPRLTRLRKIIEETIEDAGGKIIAAESERSPAIGAYAMPGMASAAQLVQFDLAGISVSAGSACSSGSLKPSAVLAAMEIDPQLAGTVIRVSLGPATSEADVGRFLECWRSIRGRAASAAA